MGGGCQSEAVKSGVFCAFFLHEADRREKRDDREGLKRLQQGLKDGQTARFVMDVVVGIVWELRFLVAVLVGFQAFASGL